MAGVADSLVIDHSLFFDNRTQFGSGGAIDAKADVVILTNSTLASNRAGGTLAPYYGLQWGNGGGARLISYSEMSLSNCTIVGNEANLGAGLNLLVGGYLNTGGTGALTHLTVSGNASSEDANSYDYYYGYQPDGVGGIAGSGDLSIVNSIIAGNTGAVPEEQDHDGGLISLGGNVVGIGSSLTFPAMTGDQIGSVASPLDPLLMQLASSGGLTPTMALQAGSPALDGGVLSIALDFDQRGFDRVRGAAPDAGAFEFETLDSICNGDGGTAGCTPCPCGNDAPAGTVGGCLNESGQAARLLRSGSSSIAAKNLSFQADRLPSSVSALLISGTSLAPANPANPCFGQASGVTFSLFDGLRCVVQNTFRHGVRVSDPSGAIGQAQAGWGGDSGLVNSGAFVAGQERHFQIFFRQDPAGSCSNGVGTTQAGTVQFFP